MPDSSKPRERFLKLGPEALSDAELFAIILRTGVGITNDENGNKVPGENVVDMSNRLIAEYGLDKLFECSLKELQQIKGIGPSKSMQLLAMAELGKRHAQSKNPITKITNAEDVYNYFKDKLRDEMQECFYVLLLNNQNIIVKEELITKGVLDSAIVHPREIFRPAIKNSAKKIILVHNHPSGNPNPSDEDLEITEKIINLGKEIDIKVLDHVIVGEAVQEEGMGDMVRDSGSETEERKGWWSWVEDK